MSSHPPYRRAFTLIELLVVITIIILLAAAVIPTIHGVFKAQSDVQAYSLLNAQLGAARAQAIMTGGYAGVHIQVSDRENDDTEGRCYLAVLQAEDSDGNTATPERRLALAPGFRPVPTPGSMAFGRFDSDYIASGAFKGGAFGDSALDDFTTMTFVFNSQGESVYLLEGENPVLANYDGRDLFVASGTPSGSALWEIGYSPSFASTITPSTASEPAVTAAVMFDLDTLTTLDSGDRKEYLDDNAQFLPINTYTGLLFPQE